MLFREMIVVCSENHMKLRNRLRYVGKMQLLIIKAGGNYSYHCVFRVLIKHNNHKKVSKI